MYLIALLIWNCEFQIKFTLHWLQYSAAPNVLYIKSSQTNKIEFRPAVLACKPKRPVAQSFQDPLQYSGANCSDPCECVVVEPLGKWLGWFPVYTLAKLSGAFMVLPILRGQDG